MSLERQLKGLFVTNRKHIGSAPGGVQTCSREYMDLLQATGIEIDVLPVDVDMRLITRVARALRTSPYTGPISRHHLTRLIEMASEADFVFLNQVNLAGALPSEAEAPGLRKKTILLSHGAEVTDLLNLVRAKKTLPLSGRLRPTPMMSVRNVLEDEIRSRQDIRGAVCLSPFDADFERWLGVPNVTWIPRTVTPAPLDWKPVENRFGFIGTLDHAPNLEGLVDVLKVLEATEPALAVRVVGGPERLGVWLEQTFKSATYLGALDELQLRQEASSWTAFLNPIFCQARGCSTKLATALGWEIPIITTPAGRRGYTHSEGDILVADDPLKFVEAMNSLTDPATRHAARHAVRPASRSTPKIAENAKVLLDLIASLQAAASRGGSV